MLYYGTISGFVKTAASGAAVGAGLASLLSSGGSVRRASAISAAISELPEEAYTTIGGDLKSCRILNGERGGQGGDVAVGKRVKRARDRVMWEGRDGGPGSECY